MADPDWKLLQTFVRVAEHGSLSAGALALGTSQPTASRAIRDLEAAFGARLFVRHARGLELTDLGADLFGAARGLDDGVRALFRRTAPRSAPRGTVRVSVNEPLGVHVLPPCFAKLRQDQPQIELEVVIDNRVSDLSRRDADVAVRMFRPKQLALIARRVGSVELGLFASGAYLRRKGTPESLEDVRQHTLIGSDRDPGWARAIGKAGLTPADFAFRTDSLVAQLEAMTHGVGIGATHLTIAARRPTLVRVLPKLSIAIVDAWLVMHEDLRTNAAVRAVFEALSVFLQQALPSPRSK